MTRVLLLATNSNLTRRVESLPGHQVAVMNGDEVGVIARSGGLEVLLGSNSVDMPEVLLIGEHIPMNESLSIAGTIGASYPQVEIVLVAEPVAELVVEAMRAGIRDIVPPSIGQDELKVLLHRISGNARSWATVRDAAPAEGANLSRTIVVASPRGGTGKSTVAANVAVALAKTAPLETVLVDLDLQFGDVSNILNLTAVHTVADAFESTAAVDTLILKTFLTVHSSGFYALCAAESPTVSDKVSGEQVTHLLKQLSSQFRYVVVDTASGLNETTLAAIEAASDLVLVSTMDLASTNALRKEITLLTEFELLPSSRHVVLNFADRKSGVGVREIESALGVPVDVVVPRTSDVLYAGNRGEPFLTRKSSGAAGKAIRQLVKRIHADEEAASGSKHRGIAVA